jgi:AcrR family transcriptional regulator
MKTAPRPYRQSRRAAAAQANTERILAAAIALYAERPFDQITLADVAERAGVGLQTLIRRVRTKDGLMQAVDAWVGERIRTARGEPVSEPAAVAAALARQYEAWGAVIERTLHQEDASPALAASARGGREAHAAWIDAAFADALAAAPDRAVLRAQLIGVCGVELWLVLRRDAGLSPDQARDAVAGLIAALL